MFVGCRRGARFFQYRRIATATNIRLRAELKSEPIYGVLRERAAPRRRQGGAANFWKAADRHGLERRAQEPERRDWSAEIIGCRYENHSIECALWRASVNGLNYFQSGSGWLGSGVDIEAEVERADAVGEGADGDEVDACGGDVADAVEGDAAAGFGERAAGDLLDGGAKIFDGEVVEHDGVDVGGEDCLDLVEAVDFDFEVGGVGECSACGEQSFGEAAGARGGEDGEVVVLGHDGVGEGEAVVVAAAAADGVALEEAEAGGGLARVDDAGLGVCGRLRRRLR